MKKAIGILAGLAILQTVFVVVANMGASTLSGQSPGQPLLSFDKTQVDNLIVQGKEGNEVVLSKKDGKWQTADGFPADQEKVDNLIGKMHDLKRGQAIANSDKAIKRFKVAKDEFERHIILQKADQKLAALYMGSGAGARQTHARSEEDGAVYTVSLGTYDVPDSPSDWQNKNILHLNKEDIRTIQLAKHVFQRDDSADKQKTAKKWKLADLPQGKHLNQKTINDNLSTLTSLSFDEILGKKDKPEYGIDKPVLTLKLTHNNGEREYLFGRLKDKADYVLKVSDRPEYFRVNENAVKPIVDGSKNWIKDQVKKESKSEDKTEPTPKAATAPDTSESK